MTFLQRVVLISALLVSSTSATFANVQLSANVERPAGITSWSDVRARLTNAYQLGRLLQEPVVGVLYLDDKLKELKNYGTDAAASKTILEDGVIAATTRTTEAKSYSDATKLIAAIDGPASMRIACEQAAATLNLPLVLSDSAKTAGDPVSARILGTLDEADRVKPDPSSLLAWIKITEGRDGLWAYHLGQLSVGVHNSIDLKHESLYQPELVPEVVKYMPADAPAPIVAAVRALRGMPQSDPKLPATIIDARQAIDSVFSPTSR